MKKTLALLLIITTLLCFMTSCKDPTQDNTPSDVVNLIAEASHDDVSLLIASGEIDVAILPEPKATVAINTANANGYNYSIALNLSTEWSAVSDYDLAMGCIAVNNSFIATSEKSLVDFLAEYEASINYIGNPDNFDTAAQIIVDMGILPKLPVSKSALTNLYGSIVYQDGSEMKSTLTSFYSAIGIDQPSDNFFYSAPASADGVCEDKIVIAVMNGPTGMGMAKMMSDYGLENDKYEFVMYSSPELAITDLSHGDVDMACLPTNSAAEISNKGVNISVGCINCLGSLYVVAKEGVEINSIEDLVGKTIYYGVPTSTTEPIFAFILNKHSIGISHPDE